MLAETWWLVLQYHEINQAYKEVTRFLRRQKETQGQWWPWQRTSTHGSATGRMLHPRCPAFTPSPGRCFSDVLVLSCNSGRNPLITKWHCQCGICNPLVTSKEKSLSLTKSAVFQSDWKCLQRKQPQTSHQLHRVWGYGKTRAEPAVQQMQLRYEGKLVKL